MKLIQKHSVAIIVLSILLCLCLGLLAKAYIDIHGITGLGGYRNEVFTLATMFGSQQALKDLRNGKLQYYELGEETDEPVFTGRHDGAFEIWHPQYYPTLGAGHRLERQHYITAYNRKMKYMYEHPDKFTRNNSEDANQPLQ